MNRSALYYAGRRTSLFGRTCRKADFSSEMRNRSGTDQAFACEALRTVCAERTRDGQEGTYQSAALSQNERHNDPRGCSGRDPRIISAVGFRAPPVADMNHADSQYNHQEKHFKCNEGLRRSWPGPKRSIADCCPFQLKQTMEPTNEQG